MKRGKTGQKKGTGIKKTRAEVSGNIVSVEILRALATATTAYHEATPDRVEEARIVYEQALERFNLAQSGEAPRTMTAGAGPRLNE